MRAGCINVIANPSDASVAMGGSDVWGGGDGEQRCLGGDGGLDWGSEAPVHVLLNLLNSEHCGGLQSKH